MTKKRQHIAKENRRNLRLWAEGAREEVLNPHIEFYADAMERGWRFEREYFATVCREFHARISWRLKDHEEPELPLPAFDATAELPAPEKLSEEEETRRQARITVLDDRIRRWMKYRVKRLRRHTRTRIGSRKDPWAILLAKLSGFTSPPKALQAYQQMMHEDYTTLVAPVVKAEWAKKTGAGSSVPTTEPDAPFRALVARKVFAEMSQEEKDGYAKRAKDEAAARRLAYEEALNEIPSKNPADRHKCIENLGTFVSPILQGIHERTGLHAVLILGGPIPKYGGDLRTIHISYGRNRSAVGSHFPQWAKERFNGVLSLMKEYLGSAFTTQDIEDAALPAGAGLEGAKFTISPHSDSDDDSSSDDSSDSDSDSSDSENEAPARKRPKKSSAKAAKAAVLASAENVPVPMQGGGGKKRKIGSAGKEEKEQATSQKRKRGGGGGEETAPGKRGAGKNTSGKATPKKRKRAEGDEATPGKGKAGRDGGEQDASPPRKSRRLAAATAPPILPISATAPPIAPANAAPTAPTAPAPAPHTTPTAPTAPTAPNTVPNAPAPTPDTTPTAPTAPTAPNTAPTTPAPAPDTSPTAPTAPTVPNTAPAAYNAAPTPPDTVPTALTAAPAPNTMPDTAPTEGSVGALVPSASAAAFLAHLPVVGQATTATRNGVEVPAECPSWLRDIVRYGSEGNLRAGLSTKNRPAEVQAWIRAGRGLRAKGSYDAGITDLGDYAKRWTAWWDSLQPTWRKRGADGQWMVGGTYGEDWATLWFPGQNGCVSLVASLYFWGASKRALGAADGAVWIGEERAKWDRTVQDVVWMVEGLENAVPGPKGRKKKGRV
ncbi:hypothetical protein B0H11DRAFT_2255890 [Mycena galericulata]|nr:hypothetical protein B0H11DRAFT_2255890 [Mycena galericulata]